MLKNWPKIILLFAFVFAALGLLAKGLGNYTPTESQSQNTGLGSSAEGENGAVHGESIGLPPQLPPDLTYYPNSTVVSSSSSLENSQLTLTAPADENTIRRFYLDHLHRSNWEKINGNHFRRGRESLEIDFVKGLNHQTVVVLNYSAVPTK